MDPLDVESAADVRSGWSDWTYQERLDALGALANSNLDAYGYDGVDVYAIREDGFTGETNDLGVFLPEDALEDTDPNWGIHTTNHETIHVMDVQDGIDSAVSPSAYPEDYAFTEAEKASIRNHSDVGGQARALDQDDYVDRAAPRSGAGASPGGGGYDGSGGGSGGSVPQSDELAVEIDWASGVWVDSTTADGSYSVDVYFAPMEGW